jgi:hypothetical protein
MFTERSANACTASPHRGDPVGVEPIRVEAPSMAAAFVLVAELADFRCDDLVPSSDGAWEVCFEDPGRRLDDMLRKIERCLGVWNIPAATVHIAGRPRTLSAPQTTR